MANKDSFQKYLDAGIAFTNLTRARAEELVAELTRDGEFRGDARAKVDELIERSRKSREALFAQVRQEVDRQLKSAGITNLEDLAKQVASLLGRTAEAGRAATSGKRAAAKKSPAKKAAAKKSPAKKTPPRSRRQEGSRQEGSRQEVAGQEGSRQEGAAKKAAAKKSPAKKAAAKKSPAKKSAPRAAG